MVGEARSTVEITSGEMVALEEQRAEVDLLRNINF